METMVEVSQRYMKANVSVAVEGKRRTTNSMDREERLWVYGRRGEECRRCGTLIQMRKQGEQARSTYWCPVCQPWAEAPVGNARVPRMRPGDVRTFAIRPKALPSPISSRPRI